MQADTTSSARVGAGGTVLALIAAPLTAPVLRAHRGGPLRLPDLHERIDGATQTTLRGQVDNLRSLGALERRVLRGMPYTVENQLTKVGIGILTVADTTERWLAQAPRGRIVLGSEAAKAAIRALVAGWGSTMLRALAARPLSLTELSSVIDELSYPALERRLSAMRAARQLEPTPNDGQNAKLYAVTNWTRQAVGPLVAAGHCESLHLPAKTERLTRIDIEAAFLLAVPLINLEVTRTGACLLAVEARDARDAPRRRSAGVHVDVDAGAVVSCVSRLEQAPATWALGAVKAWEEAILTGNPSRLRLGGTDISLVRNVVSGLHGALFPGDPAP